MKQQAPSNVVACAACGTRNRVPAAAAGTPRCGSCHQPLPWVVDALDGDFAAIAQAPVLVLVDLWAPWCGPCRTIGPLIEQAARELAGRMKVVKVNVDVAPGVSRTYGVQGIPTMLLLRDGHEVARQVGALPGHALREWIDAEFARNAS
ncbi:MAG: thioredoxin [Acidimicrobiia bacterium]